MSKLIIRYHPNRFTRNRTVRYGEIVESQELWAQLDDAYSERWVHATVVRDQRGRVQLQEALLMGEQRPGGGWTGAAPLSPLKVELVADPSLPASKEPEPLPMPAAVASMNEQRRGVIDELRSRNS
jgi:hypothetical protein